MEFRIVIPARYASVRLPGKPLLPIAGKPMIQHVHARARESGAAEVVIATDDKRIAEAAKGFGANVCMTRTDHASGTDRLAEVVQRLGWPDDALVVNLQGDEPLMPPLLLRQVAEALNVHTAAHAATLCSPIHSSAEVFDPHCVKVVRDAQGFALYFSRAPIPWHRDAFAQSTEALPEGDGIHFRHIGLYAYRAGYLAEFTRSAPCLLEQSESLEQLRVLWYGGRIFVDVAAEVPAHGVDTEADLKRAEAQLSGVAPV